MFKAMELAVCEGMKETLRRFPELLRLLETPLNAIRTWVAHKTLDSSGREGIRFTCLPRREPIRWETMASIQRLAHRQVNVDLLCSNAFLA